MPPRVCTGLAESDFRPGRQSNCRKMAVHVSLDLTLVQLKCPWIPQTVVYCTVSNSNLHCPRLMLNIERIEWHWCINVPIQREKIMVLYTKQILPGRGLATTGNKWLARHCPSVAWQLWNCSTRSHHPKRTRTTSTDHRSSRISGFQYCTPLYNILQL